MYEELIEGMQENSFCMKEDYLLEEANNGNIDAMYLLGKLNWESDYVEEAFDWFSKAAEQGQADATYFIGNFYWHPTGLGLVEPSDEKAIAYYQKAAELGSAKAMCELGRQYRQGTVTLEKDHTKAIALFQKAAELGEPEASYWLAKCYQFGIGVEKDLEKALKFAFNAYEDK